MARRLRLRINETESAVDYPHRRKFPRIQHHRQAGAPTAHRAAGARSVQEPGSRTGLCVDTVGLTTDLAMSRPLRVTSMHAAHSRQSDHPAATAQWRVRARGGAVTAHVWRPAAKSTLLTNDLYRRIGKDDLAYGPPHQHRGNHLDVTHHTGTSGLFRKYAGLLKPGGIGGCRLHRPIRAPIENSRIFNRADCNRRHEASKANAVSLRTSASRTETGRPVALQQPETR